MYSFRIKEMDRHGAIREEAGEGWVINIAKKNKKDALNQIMNMIFPMMDVPGNQDLTFFAHSCFSVMNRPELFKECISIDWERGEGLTKFWRRPLDEMLREESIGGLPLHLYFKKVKNQNGRYVEKEIGELLYDPEEGLSEIPLNFPYGEVPRLLPSKDELNLVKILRNPEMEISAYEVNWTVKNDFSEIGKNITIWVR